MQMEITMPRRLFTAIAQMPWPAHLALAAASIAGYRWIGPRLNASYAASNHPVDYATGQTTFDGATIKSYYAAMQDAGTLDVYWTTQLIDFGFIAAIAALGLFVCTLAARLSRPASWGRRIGFAAGAAAIIGALCDAAENAISFVMLSNPAEFANWLALPYSGFAVLKFAAITLAMAGVAASLLLALAGRCARRPTLG